MNFSFKLIQAVSFLLLCFLITSCTLIQLNKDVSKSLESTVITGRVRADSLETGPIIVAACSVDKEKKIAHYTVLHEPGEYELMVGQGEYYVFAFQDKNSNLIYEQGELAGQHGSPQKVQVPAVGVVFDIDIVIPEQGESIVFPQGKAIASPPPHKLYSRQAGAIAQLDDERFAPENGSKGFWEPYAFFKEFGGNIYFLEKYDPTKIPVLFIHGAAGTPEGWQYFVNHMDRTRFQPWFFYYPTGARIDSISYLLLWKLSNLQAKYQFKEMYITAHSMGGLVARSFLVNYGLKFPLVKLFISLATPWGGDKMAEYGVEQSPAVIPSWRDMQPEGNFITSLYRKKMPEQVRFYMFYGHQGTRNPFSSNNDGTIALSSLLDSRPQAEAQMNYAFNEDHTSIISSKEVVEQYNTILNEFAEQQNNSPQQSAGYLKVQVSYTYKTEGAMPHSRLILRPAGREGGEIVTFLQDEENSKLLGPFPAGDYVANMIVEAGAPQEKNIPISIKSKTTEELDVTFHADGEIRGCVTSSLKKEEKVIGMPDYLYRAVDKKVKIQSLKGC
ncbi:MAG: alpha/beta hydrolase [Candidatus Electrothrix scaldis]|nr:MAG: alpha/beta hydrolase [Candidatus Electrothrix sp. GW3-3]